MNSGASGFRAFNDRLGRWALVAIVVLSGAMAMAFSPGTADAVGTGSISGTVVDSNGQPLPNICVGVYDSEGNGVGPGGTGTDSDGHYQVGTLTTGDYRLQFTPCSDVNSNLLSEFYNDKESLAEATPVPVTDGSDTPDIDVELSIGGSISGIATGGNQEGQLLLPFICVSAYDSSGTRVDFVFTQNNHRYDIKRLHTGNYRILFVDCNVRLRPGCEYYHHDPFPCALPGVASEFYENKTTLANATPIAVTEGVPTTGIDANLGMDGSISGVVSDGSGIPLDGICVQAYARNGSDVIREVQTQSGDYHLTGLGAGSYILKFSDCVNPDDPAFVTEFYDDQLSADEAVPVTVAEDSPTDGIDIELAPTPPDPVVPDPDPIVSKASITQISVKGPKRLKRGKKATYRLIVTNSGNAAASGVKVRASGRGIASFSSSIGEIPGGASKSIKVKLKATRAGKSKITFRATSTNAGGKSAQTKVAVRR